MSGFPQFPSSYSFPTFNSPFPTSTFAQPTQRTPPARQRPKSNNTRNETMAPNKPDIRNYGIPKNCISPTGDNSEGLAFHPDANCLSLSNQVMMYNQELLFLQGREILQRLDRLDASIAATAAVCAAPPRGLAPVTAVLPVPRTFKGPTSPAAVRVGQAHVVESKSVAATVRAGPAPVEGLKPVAAPPPVRVGPAPVVASVPVAAVVVAAASDVEAKAKQPVAKATGARLPSLEGFLEKDAKFVGAMAAGSNDNPLCPRSSKTEGREQARTRNEEISQLRKEVTTLTERLTKLYEEQRQKSLLKVRDSVVTGERSHERPDPKAHTALVGKTGDNDSTNCMENFTQAQPRLSLTGNNVAIRIRETTSIKRAGSPIPTTNNDVEAGRSPRAPKQFENSHRDKKVKVEVKVKSD